MDIKSVSDRLYINLYSSTCDSNRQAGDRIYKENGKNTTQHDQ